LCRYERGSCQRSGILRHKLLHDKAHIEYLASLNVSKAQELLPTYVTAYEVLDKALSPAEAREGSGAYEFIVTEKFLKLLGNDVFKRNWHVPQLGQVSVPVVNLELDRQKYQRWYSQEQIIYVDQLLSPQALDYVYRLCSEGSYFHNVKPWGYLGAYLNDGFHHPLLLEISRRLKMAFPEIFRGHELQQLWAYKYSHDREGIKMHGDDAAVNVNIWLTPDHANLDKSSGGLVVYRRFPDPTWDYRTFNHYTNQAKLERQFRNDAVTIPYRQNRAVIFNSHLWHKTDNFRFKKGYSNRRINLTLLFGTRRSAKQGA